MRKKRCKEESKRTEKKERWYCLSVRARMMAVPERKREKSGEKNSTVRYSTALIVSLLHLVPTWDEVAWAQYLYGFRRKNGQIVHGRTARQSVLEFWQRERGTNTRKEGRERRKRNGKMKPDAVGTVLGCMMPCKRKMRTARNGTMRVVANSTVQRGRI